MQPLRVPVNQWTLTTSLSKLSCRYKKWEDAFAFDISTKETLSKNRKGTASASSFLNAFNYGVLFDNDLLRQQ
jgi:hypothetical protein